MLHLRLMTLNLRVSFIDDGPNRWEYRWPYVKDLIMTYRPDVLGVQECMPNQLAAMMGELPGYFGYPGPDTMLTSGLSIRNPVLVCQPCNLPLSQSALALNESGVIGQLSWDGKEARLAHVFRFDGWTLVNTHFDAWDSAQARYESARLLVHYLRKETAVVIMGDLNCQPHDPPLRYFVEHGYRMAKDSLPPDVDRRTFHDFTGEGQEELDYALLRGVTLREVQIPRPRQQAPFISDHDPLVVDIAVEDA